MQLDEFWSWVDVRSPSECWNWKRGRDRAGYGAFSNNGKRHLSHRHSYELCVDPIPPGHYVCHKCDNPPCCNQNHLFAGTHADNVADKVRKGRQCRGETRPTASLTDRQASQVRVEYATGMFTQQQVADRFGVDVSVVQRITHGRCWKHIAAPVTIRRTVTPEEDAQIATLRSQGISMRELMQRFDLSEPGIYLAMQRARKAGLELPSHYFMSGDVADEIKRLRSDGIRCPDIAERTGWSLRSVYRALKR